MTQATLSYPPIEIAPIETINDEPLIDVNYIGRMLDLLREKSDRHPKQDKVDTIPLEGRCKKDVPNDGDSGNHDF